MVRLLPISRRRSSMLALPAPAILAILYLAAIIVGGLALALPVSHTEDIGFMDALFTSTSAVTVTGLVVADTGSAFTTVGQVIIALLIQLGGLGLMTFAVLLLAALGIPIGLPQRMVLQEDLNQTSVHNLSALVGIIALLALASELVGTAILATVFVPEFGWASGLWHAAFHAISAFNNAGFALFPDSLSRYATNVTINLTIPLLFMVGGLGFIVIADINAKRRWRTLSLHSKLMLSGTAVLTLVSVFAICALEWQNPATLGGFERTADRLLAGWFQAVTPRTAGFNTIDTAGMTDAGTLITLVLMVIGGGSTSTAGGIKLTTAIVLCLATIAFFRKHSLLHAFGRRIGTEEVMKVMALTTVSIGLILTSLFALTVMHEGDFLDLTFETVSAFGTVGLSRGTTGELDTAGQLIIMIVMFLGRVGPLTIGFFLAARSVPRVSYAPGQVYLG